MIRYHFDFASRTDKGRVRTRNEDAVRIDKALELVVVADGIGGARSGDVASRTAIDVIAERFEQGILAVTGPEETGLLLEDAIAAANATIYDLSMDHPLYAGMGTTVVAGAVVGDWLVFAHVGDSRLYRLGSLGFSQLTQDHSLIQDVVDRGLFSSIAEARREGIGNNILTRAVGSTAMVSPSSGRVRIASGDIFLFCTDGLTNMVSDVLLGQVLSQAGDALERTAQTLVEMACDRGGVDNITLALMRMS